MLCAVDERLEYAVEKHLTDRAEAAAACSTVLEVLGPVLVAAHVDVYTDYPDEMPDPVRQAEQELAAKGRQRRPRFGASDVLMDVVVTKDDPEWSAFATYSSWSIHVALEGPDGEHLGTFHDCGYSVLAELTTEEAAAVRARLADVASVAPLQLSPARRRASKRKVGPTRTWALLGRRRAND